MDEEKIVEKESCSCCKYGGGMFGSVECKRNAPIAVFDPNKNAGHYKESYVARWPMVSVNDWCGQFEKISD